MLTLELSLALIDSLRTAEHVAVLTGAGISAESGVPTFREAQSGLWAKYDPAALATPEAFERHPQLVWDWYAWRRNLVAKAMPNAGHLALANMARRAPRFSLITQNVDNLHQRAGSRAVIELHGNLGRVKCSRENVVIDEWPPSTLAPPRCPQCGAPLRPDVVWFGEPMPSAPLAAAFTAAQTCDVFFSIGTSGVVHPAAALPFTALERGAVVIEINPTETALTPFATHHLSGPAGELLPLLYNAAWNSH